MPWEGAALVFVRESARAGSLRVGQTNVLQALDDGLAWIVIVAHDASYRLNTKMHKVCNEKRIQLYEVPSKTELSTAALKGGHSIAVCALVAADQSEESHLRLQSRWSILQGIRALYNDLNDYDP